MNECIKIKTAKYSFRPYPANKCKSMKKGNGKFYLSQPDKHGI